MPDDNRLPITLLTGFLGSGKTTLLNSWLRSPELASAAVIVNEFGEIGIDHALIETSNDNTIELSTGCLCCTVRGDLVDTLRELIVRREKGEVRAFDRVVIETTGLADPAPVIQALMTFPVSQRFRLHQIVTTVDAVNGVRTLEQHPESVKQAAVADELVITKTDLNLRAATDLIAQLKRLNPGAAVHSSSPNKMPAPSDLATVDIYDPATKTPDVARWLNADSYSEQNQHGHEHHHTHDINRHSADIGSFTLEFDKPLHWDHVANWLDALVMGNGNDLLRVKGILDIAGREQPIVVQAVQSLFHPPFELAAWPNGVRRSYIVFITRNISRDFVCEVFKTVQQRPMPPAGAAAA